MSITVTSANFAEVTGDVFIEAHYLKTAVNCSFLLSMFPYAEGTEELVLSNEQKTKLNDLTSRFHSNFNGLFITFPGDEQVYDGCLACRTRFCACQS